VQAFHCKNITAGIASRCFDDCWRDVSEVNRKHKKLWLPSLVNVRGEQRSHLQVTLTRERDSQEFPLEVLPESGFYI